ncbi:uncharacterized protein LOC132599610 [Lycium barbarum]|uniref:uncharacterized protein LOC132599610 n=1 Tax=Lycium barbarum TaxID=112863 RepID=UPI00293F474D|nr:uncharacterized protein LOC132599610 [Lycium barbarum]
MEEMASLWSYQETMDEMREKLLYTSLELEQLQVEKNEEMKKNNEYAKQLIQLLKMVCQERDEAKDQLQKLLNKLDSPLVKVTKANSSITESNSLHNSSPIDSFFDTVSSPEFSNNNMADSNAVAYMNQPLANDCNVRLLDNCVPQMAPKVDNATLVIDSFVKGKTLPQQGKLLKAVVEAGPLLQTLLVSGQLPQWHNPPQLKSFNIPQVSIIANQNIGANLSYISSRSFHSQPYFDMSCGSSQMLSTPMLNFANSATGSCLENQSLMSAGADFNSFVQGNRQR